jgi:NAD(P)-dependent dehydrogenase (short-subunit alcohol dehydrogenase family)
MTSKPRTIMITGAAGNLGTAAAKVFSSQGDTLALFDSDGARLEAVHGADSARQMLVAVDLLDKLAVESAVAEIVRRFGGIDVLCNIAGGFAMGPAVHEIDDEHWAGMFRINASTVIATARAVVPRMLAAGGGKIINVSAGSAMSGKANMGAYCSAKAAVLRLTESMASELREKGINVNCVLPSVIDTPQNRAAMPKADPKRWVAPEALADVIAFLASDAARAIHGAGLPVSGLS